MSQNEIDLPDARPLLHPLLLPISLKESEVEPFYWTDDVSTKQGSTESPRWPPTENVDSSCPPIILFTHRFLSRFNNETQQNGMKELMPARAASQWNRYCQRAEVPELNMMETFMNGHTPVFTATAAAGAPILLMGWMQRTNRFDPTSFIWRKVNQQSGAVETMTSWEFKDLVRWEAHLKQADPKTFGRINADLPPSFIPSGGSSTPEMERKAASLTQRKKPMRERLEAGKGEPPLASSEDQ